MSSDPAGGPPHGAPPSGPAGSATTDRLPSQVDTPRLVLRRWGHDEAALASAAIERNIDHLRPWMPWVRFEPLTIPERVQLIEGWTREWEQGGDVIYGVFLDGDVVGGSGLHRRTGPGTLEIGYWIHVDHLRQGYATELTTSLTTAAFDIAGITVVHVRTDEANEASAGVPAKLGFTRAGVVERQPEAPAESGQQIDWTMTAGQWAARTRP